MLKTINLMSESTIVGWRSECRTLNLSQPELAPLRKRGIRCALLVTTEERYRLLRGNHEPLHTNLLYILEGEVDVETNVGEWVAGPGTLIHFPSSVSRRIELRSGPRCREMYFRVSHAADDPALRAAEVTVRPSALVDKVRGSLEQCMEESLRRDALSSQLLAAQGEALTAYLEREVHAAPKPRSRDYRAQLVELWGEIRDAPGGDWSLERMAARIPISPTHFYRLVQKHCNCSPTHYVTHLRMEQAKLLLQGNFPIAEVAALVGYANEYSFSNAFLKATGSRPGAFRTLRRSGAS